MNPHWTTLKEAYAEFLKRRKENQGEEDVVSVIQFSDKVKIEYERVQCTEASAEIAQLGGGTNYYIALEKAKEVLQPDSKLSSIVMIFMSDGEDYSKKDTTELIQRFKEDYKTNHSLVFHTVAFGAAIAKDKKSLEKLESMAKAGNVGYSTIVHGVHFRGGTITWRPLNNTPSGSTVAVQIRERYSWNRITYPCDDATIALHGTLASNTYTYVQCYTGSCGSWTNMDIVTNCTDFSAALIVSSGEHYETKTIPLNISFSIGFVNGNWLTNLVVGDPMVT
ncbi:unnamed protein product [Adineta steineri]|uniref:VWFA domain-containing protein n=1 Tax=Adineta steineri TaxID=433720 RepID=A0A814ETI5_9BILA|nr:unnamed protein product [Adineta steineri]CAF3743502.1 unnamed protein product [Adineta steineri]